MQNSFLNNLYKICYFKFWIKILINVFLIFSFQYIGTSQPCNDPQPPQICDPSNPICISELNGYCMQSQVVCVSGNYNEICLPWNVQNVNYFPFIASTPYLSVSFTSSTTSTQNPFCPYYSHVGIYKAPCPPNGINIICNGPSLFPNSLSVSTLIPGDLYYLWIGKCSGIEPPCDITINVNSMSIGNITGPKKVCVGTVANYKIQSQGNSEYYWTLDGVSLEDPATAGNEIDITFTTPGVHKVCLDIANECADVNDAPLPSCIDVTVEKQSEYSKILKTCKDESVFFDGNEYFAGTYEVIKKSTNYCDTLVHLTVEEYNVPEKDLGLVYRCYGDCLSMQDKFGNSFDFCDDVEDGEAILQSWTGCDSIIHFSLKVILLDVQIQKAKELSCTISKIDLDGGISNIENADNLTIKWTALNGGILSGPDNELLSSTETPGKYCLTLSATSPTGVICKDSACVIVKGDPNAPTAIIKGDTLTCIKDTIQLIGSSNTPGITYSWLGPDSTIYINDTISIDTPGVYTLSITTPNNCVVKTNFNVPLIKENIEANISGDSLDCSNETVILEAVPTIQGTSIQWSDPNGKPIIGNPVMVDEPGIYKLNISLSKLCSVDSTYNVILTPNILKPGIIGDTITCTKDTIDLIGSSNIPASYNWNGPNTINNPNSTIKVFNPGVYTLSVTSNKFCTSDTSITITENIIKPNISATGGTIDCISGQTVLKGNSNTPNVTYQWFDNNGNPLANTKDYTASGSGIYTLEVTDPVNGCVSDITVEALQDNNTPNLTISKSGNLNCKIQSVDITASSSTAGVNYTWSGSGSGNMISTTNPGTYSVTVTNPANGCKNVASIVIDQDLAKPKLSAIADTIKCNNNKTAFINGSVDVSNINVIWKDPNGTVLSNTLNFSTTVSQSIKLIVTNNDNGCQDSISVFVPENTAAPVFSIKADTITCYEPIATAVTTSQTQNVSFSWSGPGYSATTKDAENISTPGTYILIVTDIINGCSDSKSVVIEENKKTPDIQATGGVLNCANNKQITLTSSSSITGVTYNWTGPNNFTSNQQNPTVTESGTYTISITDPENGCTKDTTVQVNEDEEYPNLTVNNGSIDCINLSLTLTANSTIPGTTYNWNGPGVINNPNQTITVSTPGNYICIATAPNGCTNDKTAIVTNDAEYPIVLIQTIGVLDCNTASVNITTNGSSIGPEYQYTWSGPAGSNPNGSSFNTGVPGNYSLTINNTQTGCSSSSNITINQSQDKPSSIESFIKDPSCFGIKDGQISISGISGGTPPYQFSLNGSAFSTKTDYSNLAPGTYSLSIKDVQGCSFDTSFILMQPIKLEVDAGRDTIINWGTIIELNATPNQVGNFNVFWQPQLDSNCINCLHQTIQLFNPQIFTVTIKDINNCEASDEVRILVTKSRPVYIPNIFSPNADGINDIFYIYSKDNIIEEIEEFRVYDRWGEELFKEHNCPPNDSSCGWNGKFRGKYVNSGVYVYWARIKFKDGSSEIFKGDVTVQR